MLTYLKFKELEDIELKGLTKNTIILFHDIDMLFKFKKQMLRFKKDLDIGGHNNITYLDYATHTDDLEIEPNIKIKCNTTSFVIYDIDNGEQTIILTTEISAIMLLKDLQDLWFIEENLKGKWRCYSLDRFIGHEKYKDDNIKLIKSIVQGRFGCYEKYGL